MRLILAILFASILPLKAAEAVLDGAIMPRSWGVITIENGETNGTFNAGFSNLTNNTFTISNPGNFLLNVNSPGYGEDAETNIWTATFRATSIMRHEYPNHAFPRTVKDGSDLKVYLAFEDFIFNEDTGLEATIAAGLYSWNAGANSNAAATITLTNWSELTYPKVHANSRTIPFHQITNTTMRTHGLAFHPYATGGRPVAAFQFFVSDESGNTLTNTQTQMRVDYSRREQIKNGEYFADFDLTSLTHSNLLRIDYRAVPHRGNAASVIDTRDNTYTWPTFLPCSITNFYYTNAYGSVAVVSPNGTNATGVVYPWGTDPTTIPDTDYFLDPRTAFGAMQTNNNSTYGHNTIGSSTAYLRTGVDRPFGSTVGVGATPKTWAMLKVYPGDSVTLTNDTGTDDLSDRVMLEGFTISPVPNTSIMFNGVQALHFTNCIFLDITTATGPIYNSSADPGVVYFTGNTFQNWSASLPRLAAGVGQHAVLWNNDLSGHNQLVMWLNAVGNWKTGTVARPNFSWADDASGSVLPLNEMGISYNNVILSLTNTAPASIGLIRDITLGKSFIQNVMEGIHTSGASFGVSQLTAPNTEGIWYSDNTIAGMRHQWFYNSAPATTGAVKIVNFIKDSIVTALGEATDTDSGGPNGARTNDWTMRHRVGGSEIFNQMMIAHGAPMFNGLNSFRPADGYFGPTNGMKYVLERGSYSSTPTGDGNYRLRPDSPAFGSDYARGVQTPIDPDGMARGAFDPPGAYVAGNPKRGAFF